MKVLMLPTLKQFEGEESGIKRVVEAYHRYAGEFGIEFVDCDVNDESAYDLFVSHAGTSSRYPKKRPIVSCCHGLYWTADYNSAQWEWRTNSDVIESLRIANAITVPTQWVAESIYRDMRRYPVYVVPHGVDAEKYAHDLPHKGYVLWNKNRASDVCSPEPMIALAKMSPRIPFVSTFASRGASDNVRAVGIVAHDEMTVMVQEAAIYLSTTKETFGIGVLEALAAGTPVLGFNYGGNSVLVEHGVNGYLAEPGNYEDLKAGLDYCLKYRDALSRNAKISARKWTWKNAVMLFSQVLTEALARWEDDQLSYVLPEELYLTSSREKPNEHY